MKVAGMIVKGMTSLVVSSLVEGILGPYESILGPYDGVLNSEHSRRWWFKRHYKALRRMGKLIPCALWVAWRRKLKTGTSQTIINLLPNMMMLGMATYIAKSMEREKWK